MSAAGGNTYLKQIKASPVERINGKVKLPAKTEGGVVGNGHNSGSTKAGQQGEGMSPEQRRRVSGRPPMTSEEQKVALRKRVCSELIVLMLGGTVYSYH
jgi:hypothetical protein